MNIYVLFGVAALDKFSFNGIRALLVMYLITHLHFLDANAYQSYAAIMALAFMMPLICGYVADKLDYSSKLLIFSGLWVAVGMFVLMLPSTSAFYFAMAALVVGSGFIKTVVPSLVGMYAASNNENEDSLYAKLYVFFNIGSFLGTIGCSVIGEVFGWNYGFLAAGFSMLLVCILSLLFSVDDCVIRKTKMTQRVGLSLGINIMISMLVFSAFIFLCFQSRLSLILYIAFSVALIILVFRGREKFKDIMYLVYLMLIHTIFYALYEQSSLSLVVFTDKMVDRSPTAFFPILSNISLFNHISAIPVTAFQTIDPILNILLGGFFVKVWKWIADLKSDISYVAKFCLGLMFISFAFYMLSAFSGNTSLVSPWLLVAIYTFFVFGEQCVVPMGFSAVNSLSPKQFLAFSMGVWFASIAISETLAGYISQLLTPLSVNASMAEYKNAFWNVSAITAILGVSFYIIYRFCVLSHSKKLSLLIHSYDLKVE